jgi:molecular chaperone DnaJ
MAAQREWFEKDYYRVLGVSDTATAKEIKSAYRKLSRQYHPDQNAGDAAAEERFKEISAAYDVVGDAERRKEYDEVRRLGPAAAGFPGGRRRAAPASGSRTWATSATCSAACSAGPAGPARAPGAPAPPGPGPRDRAAPRLPRRRPGRHHRGPPHLRRHLLHLQRQRRPARHRPPALRAVLRPGRAGREPGPVQLQPAVPVPAPAAACWSTTRAAPAGAPVWSAGPGRSRSASPPASTRASASGSRAGAAPGRNGGPPATSTWWSTWPTTRSSAARAGPHHHGPDHLPRGHPRRRHHRAHPHPGPGHAAGPGRHPLGRTFRVRGKGVATSKGGGDLLVTVEVAVPSKLTSAERKAVEALQAAGSASPRAHLGV